MLENHKNIEKSIEFQDKEFHIWQVERKAKRLEGYDSLDSLAIVKEIANCYYSNYLPPNQTTYILKRSKRKKPYFQDSILQFSLTHTRDVLIIAYTRYYQLGIDLESSERLLTHSRILSLTERFFHPNEKEKLHQLASNLPDTNLNPHLIQEHRQTSQKLIQVFLELWTQKEAYAKALDIPLFTTLKLSTSEMESQVEFFPLTFKPSFILTLALKSIKTAQHSQSALYQSRFFKF